MEKKQQEQEAASFEHSVNNTRLESQPNELLAQVKARVSEQIREQQTRATKKGRSRT
jgi:hypothetical protein